MKQVLTILCIFYAVGGIAQTVKYTTANAHSHNDYEQSRPFFAAWSQGFGSIEADIFLQDGHLLVAHQRKALNEKRTLESLYLDPLQSAIKNNHGHPYSDKGKQLQLMIDVKTDSVATLNALIELLQHYSPIIHCPEVLIVISGNRPSPASFIQYPSYIQFDGVLSDEYSAAALSKIVMLSDDFKKYSWWNGSDSLLQKDRKIITAMIGKAHRLHKKIRFWDAPDSQPAWKTFMDLQVDYINTDHIQQLADFLKGQ